jgi:hypothetical protein
VQIADAQQDESKVWFTPDLAQMTERIQSLQLLFLKP